MAEPAPGPLVLLVDDDPGIRRSVGTGLELEGFRVLPASGGRAGLAAAASQRPDVVLLDLGMPDLDGIAVLRELRGGGDDVPVCILSARDEVDDRVRGLEAGADDYVVKPFGMAELLARIRVALRRGAEGGSPEPVFRVGGLEVDLAQRIVRVDGAEVRLSPKQYRLLQVLVSNAGKVVTHRQLLGEVWGAVHRDDIQYLRVFVRKLRSRIEADPARPRYLQTELGVGYRLRTPEQLAGAA